MGAALLAPESSNIEFETSEYYNVEENGFVSVQTQPFSTFGADVDTASYTDFRQTVLAGSGSYDTSAMRTEEFINYFRYDYKEPEKGKKFALDTELTDCPWNDGTKLLRIGAKAEKIDFSEVKSNIVLLVDTSGSMSGEIDLVKQALEVLVNQLSSRDRVSIVAYANMNEVVLDSAKGSDKERIIEAVNRLETDGATDGESAIQSAYELAEKNFIDGGNNRIILITDGDFNVGVTSEAELNEMISEKRDTGIFLSCVGVGHGNYSDTTMETLADRGNGNYNFMDSFVEVKRIFGTELFGNLYTVAKDTKFQVEFNPNLVKGYRLIGYENRKMDAEDFEDDKKDGGEVGSDQAVTVLYEIALVDSDFEIGHVSSRYQNETKPDSTSEFDDELCIINVRYKEPDGDKSTLENKVVRLSDYSTDMDENTTWASGVAQFVMLCRNSEYKGTATIDSVKKQLKSVAIEDDARDEFIYIVNRFKNSADLDEYFVTPEEWD